MRLNRDALNHAKELVEQGKYVTDSDWSKAQPSADEENDFQTKHGWIDYSNWYLGNDMTQTVYTKGYYHFPYGDFDKVHRDGLIAVKQRAAQYYYSDIEKAADELLQMIDEREREKT